MLTMLIEKEKVLFVDEGKMIGQADMVVNRIENYGHTLSVKSADQIDKFIPFVRDHWDSTCMSCWAQRISQACSPNDIPARN